MHFIPYSLWTDFRSGSVTNGTCHPWARSYLFLGLSCPMKALALDQWFSTSRVHQNPLQETCLVLPLDFLIQLAWDGLERLHF